MRRIIQVLAVLAALVVGGYLLFFRPDTRRDGPTAPDVQQVQLLETEIVSQDKVTYAKAWAHSNLPSLAPKGTVVDIDESSFEATGNVGRANARVDMPGKPSVTVSIRFVYLHGQWLVYDMEEVK